MDFQRFIEQDAALYREVIKGDCYRLASLDFTPDTVIDLGANIGCFTALAKSYWPRCKVVSVEPHPETFARLTANVGHLTDVTLVQAAIGRGLAFFHPGATLGCNMYHSEMMGYGTVGLASDERYTPAPGVQTILLPDVMPESPGRFVLKIDCEGGEAAIMDDIASTDIVHQADYWAAEIHFMRRVVQSPVHGNTTTEHYLTTHGDIIRHRLEWIYHFSATHKVEITLWPNAMHTWCLKK